MKNIILFLALTLSFSALAQDFQHFQEAPFVAGEIHEKGSDRQIRVVCVEFEADLCRSFQFVKIENDERVLINERIFRFGETDHYKKKLKHHALDNVDNDALFTPFSITKNALAVCVVLPPLFLVTLPVDIALAPYTVPSSLLRKRSMKNAINTLFKEGKKKTLKHDKFYLLEFVLRYLQNPEEKPLF